MEADRKGSDNTDRLKEVEKNSAFRLIKVCII